ncbi:MAG: phage holin family protein [Bacteroidetes bacterium]|nr:phage holin family protein [Bacteroidota bacterium]
MHFILTLLLEAGVILLMAALLKSIYIKDFKTAFFVTLVLGILNATIGLILRFPLNLFTLFLLTFIVRLVVTAFLIKVVDKFFSGFKVDTFGAALLLALAMAVAGGVFDSIYYS